MSDLRPALFLIRLSAQPNVPVILRLTLQCFYLAEITDKPIFSAVNLSLNSGSLSKGLSLVMAIRVLQLRGWEYL